MKERKLHSQGRNIRNYRLRRKRFKCLFIAPRSKLPSIKRGAKLLPGVTDLQWVNSFLLLWKVKHSRGKTLGPKMASYSRDCKAISTSPGWSGLFRWRLEAEVTKMSTDEGQSQLDLCSFSLDDVPFALTVTKNGRSNQWDTWLKADVSWTQVTWTLFIPCLVEGDTLKKQLAITNYLVTLCAHPFTFDTFLDMANSIFIRHLQPFRAQV